MIKKALFIIGLCILPMIGQADTKELAGSKEFGIEITACKLYYHRTNAQLDKYNKETYQKLLQNNDETTACYRNVFKAFLKRYYDMTDEQAQQFSENLIQEIHQQYYFMYNDYQECNSRCQKHLIIQFKSDANNTIQGCLSLANLIDYFSKIRDNEFIDNMGRDVFDYYSNDPEELKECQDAYKGKVCFDYDDNNCLKNNLNVLNEVKICYSKQLNNLLVQYYGKTDKEAEMFTQNLWNTTYKNFSLIYGKHEYMLKKSKLMQETSATILTVLYLHDYLYDMINLVKNKKNDLILI